jgi:hypothetical protein
MAVDSYRRVICARCGGEFDCSGDAACWCMRVEIRLPMPQAGDGCLCPDCLQAGARPVATRGEK